MTDRRCISCWKIKDRDELIKVIANNADGQVIINPDSVTFGRSVYLCYNKTCIETAFKKNKIEKHLNHSIPNELKGQLLDELRNS